MKNRKIIIAALLASVLCPLLFTSCPDPLETDILTILQDQNGPVITISSPSQESEYESSITINGTIIDLDNSGESRTTDAGSYIKSASYMVLNHDTENTDVEISDDGSFSFSIETADYSTQISVYILTEDLNGNASSSTLTLNPDTDGPNLVITSPDSEYTEYSTSIILEGYVTDSISGTSFSEVCTEIAYEISGTNVSGTVSISQTDGSFSTTIDASSVDGSRTLEITAEDLNFNTTTVVIDIEKPDDGGDISDFTITPGNNQVTISWEEVSNAQSYTISELRWGLENVEIEDKSVTSYTWSGLTNGLKYTFELTANMPDSISSDAVSSQVTKMPYNSRILTPEILTTGYKSITLKWYDWTESLSINEYILERSISPDGPWTTRGIQSGTEYTDSDVEHDTNYYYKITPSEFDDVTSDYTSVVPGRFGIEELINYSVPASADNFAVSGNYVYICEGEDGIEIVNITDSDNPASIEIYDTDGDANDVALSGDYAFVADGNNGLLKLDISNPSSPSLTGTYSTSGSAWGVVISGDYAYVTESDNGFEIFDISATGSSTSIASYDSTDYTLGIYVSGDMIYVADGDNGLRVYNFSNETLAFEGSYNSGFSPDWSGVYNVAVSGDYAYVTDSISNLFILNISDPANITSAGSYTTSAGGYAFSLALSGNFLGVSLLGDRGTEILNISTPTSPILVNSYSIGNTFPNIEISENYVFIIDFDDELQGIYLPFITPPTQKGNYSLSNYSYDICRSGNNVYIANSSAGLQIIDTSDPENPSYTGSYGGGYLKAVAVSGKYTFAADHYNGVQVFETSDPQNPNLIGNYDPNSFETDRWVYDIEVSSGIALIASCTGITKTNGKILLVDISTPSVPVLYSSYSEYIIPSDIAISGTLAFLTSSYDSYGDLTILDISSPETPTLKGNYDTANDANSLMVSGNYAYLACDDNGSDEKGFCIIDISDPSSPSLSGSCNTPGDAEDIYLSGEYAFVTDDDGWLSIFDISDPAAPYLTTEYYVSSDIYGITVAGSYAYIADYHDGLIIINLLGDE